MINIDRILWQAWLSTEDKKEVKELIDAGIGEEYIIKFAKAKAKYNKIQEDIKKQMKGVKRR